MFKDIKWRLDVYRGTGSTGAAGAVAPCPDSTGAVGAAQCPCKHATAGLQGYVRFTIIIFA